MFSIDERAMTDKVENETPCSTDEGDEVATITHAEIKGLEDVVEAMMLAEKHEINVDTLESLDEIQTRLKCHLTLVNEGNLKSKMDAFIRDLGLKDGVKKENLARLIKEVKNIFPTSTARAVRRQEIMEDLLNKDGTTYDIRQDCDLRIASLKEKECVILVSGESSAGKSSLLNLLLGEEILPSHMLPCTSCITVIKYNSYRCAKILYKNGEIVSIPKLDKEGLQSLQQRAYFSKATEGNDKSEIYKTRKEGHDVAEIQVYLPLAMLYSGLVLVDTPGIGENEFLENCLMEYIRSHQILGFMYIIMTDNALGVAEDRLVNLMSLIIKSQKSSSDVVKFNPKAALFVCNRWDMVTADSKRAVRENVLKQLGKSWPDFDVSNAVFFSTFQAQREISLNEGYITDEYVALLHGLQKLVDVSIDKRIKASYRWIGTVLQRSIHYLKTMVHRLELSDKDRQQKTQEVAQKLKALKEKADDVISSLYNEVEVAVEDISHQVRNYLHTTQAKTKLTKNWGRKEGELPDMDYASGTWEWIKRHIDTAFDDRLTDLLEEWDEHSQYIPTLERRLFREAKLNLCELEGDLAEVENDVQHDNQVLSRSTSVALLSNLCRSIEDFEEEDLLDEEVPKKLVHRLKNFMTKTIRKKQNDAKLKEYSHNPSRIAQKRSEKLLDSMIKDKDERLENFIKDFLQRPYTYIKRLESKIPGLIDSNMTLLEQFEREILDHMKSRTQYTEMAFRIEKIRRDLVVYGEDNFFVSDFEEKDVKIVVTPLPMSRPRGLAKRPSMADLMKAGSTKRNMVLSEFPHGLWHGVYLAEITRGSETQHVAVKIYSPDAEVENSLQEVAKLRCLLHNDVCIAEFLGVFQQKESPTPALIFSGRLFSLRQYMKTSGTAIDANKLLQETLTGLQYLHSKGLVHMELSRDTISMSEKGEVTMTGGCLPRRAALPVENTKLFSTDFVYLPPEVIQGEMYDACADMYAFAILTLEIKLSSFEAFSNVQTCSLEDALLIALSAREYFEDHVRNLSFSQPMIQKLLLCLDRDMSNRPDAADLGAELKGRKRAIVTPKRIFSWASSTKKK